MLEKTSDSIRTRECVEKLIAKFRLVVDFAARSNCGFFNGLSSHFGFAMSILTPFCEPTLASFHPVLANLSFVLGSV